MSELDNILNIIEQAPEEFASKIPNIEKKIFQDVSLLLKDLKVSPNGKIEVSVDNLKLINEIKAKLGKIVVSKEYSNLVNKFVENIPVIFNSQISSNNLPAVNREIIRSVTKEQINGMLETLVGAGYKQNVGSKIYDMLLTAVTSGSSYSDLTEQLRNQILTTDKNKGILSEYVQENANDSISQYDRSVTKLTADALGYNWFAYTVSNITTTREFCKHMTKKRYFHRSEIPALLTGMIDGHQCEIYEKYGLPNGMIEDTNEDNFLIYLGGYNCRHRLIALPDGDVPKAVRERIENVNNLESNLNKLKDIGKKDKSGILYNDLTLGIAPKLIRIVNEKLDNRERTQILRDIIENKGFNILSKNTERGTVTNVFNTVIKTDSEYNDNKNAAQALNNNGYDVYMLPKLSGSKSFDYILSKGNKIYTAELKTIYGKNSIDHRLNKANEQTDRIVLNIVGNITSRTAADRIQNFYLKNPQVKEVIVLKSGKPIYVDYEHAKRKNFGKTFMDKWAR